MPEEQTQTVDNAAMQDDFFGDVDNGSMDEIFGNEPAESTSDAETAENGDGGQPSGNEEGDPSESGDASVDNQFMKAFFNEDGSYDVKKSFDFFDKQFKGRSYGVSEVSQAKIPVAQPEKPATLEPEKQPWEQAFERRDKYRNERKTMLTKYKEYVKQAVENNVPENMIEQYADQMLERDLSLDVEKWEFEQRHKQEEEAKRIEAEKRESLELMPQSRGNLAKAFESIGGEQKFNDLIFGKMVEKSVDGKKVQELDGFGVPLINAFYKEATKGESIPPEKVQDHFKDWWTRFTASPGNLDIVLEVATAKLHNMHMQHIVRNIRSSAKQQGEQNRRMQKSPLSNIQKQPQMKESKRSADDPLGIMNTPDFFDEL